LGLFDSRTDRKEQQRFSPVKEAMSFSMRLACEKAISAWSWASWAVKICPLNLNVSENIGSIFTAWCLRYGGKAEIIIKWIRDWKK